MSDQHENTPTLVATEESIHVARPINGSNFSTVHTIDTVSKVAALGIALIYVFGFLVTSLNDFRYGFAEMNPFRPRILAAGGWFFLFLVVPFQLFRLLSEHPLWKAHANRWYKIGALSYEYYLSAAFIAGPAHSFLFVAPDYVVAFSPHWWIPIVVAIILLVVCLVLLGLEKTPTPVKAIILFAMLGWFLWSASVSVCIKRQFGPQSIELWMWAVAAISFIETKTRFRMTSKNWPLDLYLPVLAVFVFATEFYPHMKASLGGGATIPVQVTFTRDFQPMPNQTIGCMMIDETDSGFYVLGKGVQHATFIPKSEVALIHFGDAIEPSILAPKAK